MNGLDALSIIMKNYPLPVLMVSSLTTDGADATFDALDLGAVDFISKDLSHVSVNIVKIREELIAKVKSIVRSPAIRLRFARGTVNPKSMRSAATRSMPVSVAPPSSQFAALVVGVSTGGPHALLQLLPALPSTFPLGIAVVQHMPPHFTKSMAERLNSLSHLRVKEAEHGDRMEAGTILIAPGGKHLTFAREARTVSAVISDEPKASLYRPSADVMMSSAASTFLEPIIGLIMTGMGKDGLEGLKLIRHNGGYVVAQNEESCVVYGMPKAAVDEGIVDSVVSLDSMAESLVQLTRSVTHNKPEKVGDQ